MTKIYILKKIIDKNSSIRRVPYFTTIWKIDYIAQVEPNFKNFPPTKKCETSGEFLCFTLYNFLTPHELIEKKRLEGIAVTGGAT